MPDKHMFAKIKAKLFGKSFLANTLALVSGSVVAQIITVAASPILTKVYSPAEMGFYSNYISCLSVMSAMVCLQYDKAVILPEKEEDAANVLGLCMATAVAVAVLCALAVIPLRGWIAARLHAPQLMTWICLLPLSVIIAGVTSSLQHWNARKRNLKRVALTNTVATGTASGTQILLGLPALHLPGGMICGHIVGHGASALMLTCGMLRDDLHALRAQIKPSQIKAMAARYRKFPFYSVPSALCDTLCAALPGLLLAAYFDSTIAGYYGLSYRLLSLPLTVISASVSQALLPELREAQRKGSLRETVLKTYRMLLRLGLAPMLLLALVAPSLIAFIFGGVWYTSGRYIQWLAAWLLLSFVYSPLSNLFVILERQRKFMLLNAVVLLTRLAALVGGGRSGDHMATVAACGILGAVMAMIACCYALSQADVKAGVVFSCLLREALHSLPYILPTVLFMLLFNAGIWCAVVAVASGCVFLLLEGKTLWTMLRNTGKGE